MGSSGPAWETRFVPASSPFPASADVAWVNMFSEMRVEEFHTICQTPPEHVHIAHSSLLRSHNYNLHKCSQKIPHAAFWDKAMVRAVHHTSLLFRLRPARWSGHSIHSSPPEGKVGPVETIIGFSAFSLAVLGPAGWILYHLPSYKME
ncbi:uncharacterized protein LOC125694665 isoform X2 [Lagopus muta]|uniref:uncharacterized protein LOC125694665 isoform X2 n=1 Tax=Lagopus muta TaxID=64668 RepID=UPI00209D6715|nr:uncharacterized protein LOC125694665 isoform X2 [Lagopus muta]